MGKLLKSQEEMKTAQLVDRTWGQRWTWAHKTPRKWSILLRVWIYMGKEFWIYVHLSSSINMGASENWVPHTFVYPPKYFSTLTAYWNTPGQLLTPTNAWDPKPESLIFLECSLNIINIFKLTHILPACTHDREQLNSMTTETTMLKMSCNLGNCNGPLS